jgi:DegV family protein with EDD domain
MERVRVITDSNSGITQKEAEELGIKVVPMPFTIDGEEYFEEITISQEKFYEFLAKGADVLTSQPSRVYLEELWENELQDADQIVYIPMSSGLSGSCDNASIYAKSFDGKVEVVNNRRISVTQKESVMEALKLAEQGKSAKEIKEYLEETGNKSSIYIMVNDLKYLKKGGRISRTASAIGSMLRLKPVLTSRGGSFEKYAIAMSLEQAKSKMLVAVKKDLENDFKQEYESGKMVLSVAHTNNLTQAQAFAENLKKALPNLSFHFVDSLSLSVSCHIGPGSLACALSINSFQK